MQPINALKSAFKNYVNFSGRASRGDYWWYVLAYVIVAVVLTFLDKVLFGGGSGAMDTADGGVNVSFNAGTLTSLWILANLIPSISAAVRRLHDGDRSGWWYLLVLIPLVNLYLLYLLIIKGTTGDNRFGPDSVA